MAITYNYTYSVKRLSDGEIFTGLTEAERDAKIAEGGKLISTTKTRSTAGATNVNLTGNLDVEDISTSYRLVLGDEKENLVPLNNKTEFILVAAGTIDYKNGYSQLDSFSSANR